MPYNSISDLPDQVKDNLPKHAQEIYVASFNSAYEQYQDPDKRDDPTESTEEVAHQVAWAAVKNSYEKKGDEWVEKK